jgi:hypothetical protein
MHEWVLLLNMIGKADRPTRLCPPPQAAAVVAQPAPDPDPPRLNADERRELRKAAEALARQATGAVRFDSRSGFYLPSGRGSVSNADD